MRMLLALLLLSSPALAEDPLYILRDPMAGTWVPSVDGWKLCIPLVALNPDDTQAEGNICYTVPKKVLHQVLL